MDDPKNLTEQEWKERLTAEQYHILREKGTEIPFSGALYTNQKTGMYMCAACKQPLFSSDAKFDSDSGWPSFDDPINREHVAFFPDDTHNMHRTEVRCKRCGSHLGHLFPDDHTKTGVEYCINSTALQFEATKENQSPDPQ